MRRGREVHFLRPGAPLQIVQVDVGDPGPGEIVVRLELGGICGSDIHRLAGDLPFSGDPACFGHEATGFVEAIGDGGGRDRAGAPLAVGDRVYWFPVALCGECEPCVSGQSISYCKGFVWPAPASKPNAASFQDFATLGSGVPVYRIPDAIASAAVIAFGCAMPTAIGGLQRLGDIAGQDVVVQGCGPLGLAATVLAVRQGARVITIGDPHIRLDMARRLGASETLSLANTTPEERKARIRKLTAGCGPSAVIEAAGHISAFGEGLDLVAPYGRYLIMGLFSGRSTTPVNPVTINNRNLTIIGTIGYPVEALQETIAIAGELGERYDFAGLISHRFPLDRTEEAIATVARGEAIKAVVVP